MKKRFVFSGLIIGIILIAVIYNRTTLDRFVDRTTEDAYRNTLTVLKNVESFGHEKFIAYCDSITQGKLDTVSGSLSIKYIERSPLWEELGFMTVGLQGKSEVDSYELFCQITLVPWSGIVVCSDSVLSEWYGGWESLQISGELFYVVRRKMGMNTKMAKSIIDSLMSALASHDTKAY